MRDFGGVVACELKASGEQTKRFAESTKLFMLAESLGGVESIIGYPALMSHGCLPESERIAKGITPNLVRLSVGIEDIEDITFKDLSKVDIVGVYPDYASAYAVWKSKAQQTVDNAEMRYFVVHLHRLLEPGIEG